MSEADPSKHPRIIEAKKGALGVSKKFGAATTHAPPLSRVEQRKICSYNIHGNKHADVTRVTYALRVQALLCVAFHTAIRNFFARTIQLSEIRLVHDETTAFGVKYELGKPSSKGRTEDKVRSCGVVEDGGRAACGLFCAL